MNQLTHILAAGREDMLELVILVVVLVLSVIGSAIKKLSERRTEQRAERRDSQPAPPVEPAQSVRRPVRQRTQPVQSMMKNKPDRPPVVSPRAQEEVVRTDEELRRQLRRMKDQEIARRQRMAAPKSAEADTAAIESRILRIPQADRPRDAGETLIQLGLLDPRQARLAVILHEVLSPPKAIREGVEMWDM